MGILFTLMSCQIRESTGTIKGHIKTFDKNGRTRFYVYVLDDKTKHVFEKEVDATQYFTATDSSRVKYRTTDIGIISTLEVINDEE